MSEATVAIGDKWAKAISRAFQSWAISKAAVRGQFDPTELISGAFYESGEAQLEDLGELLSVRPSFNMRSPEAEAWIEKYTGEQIKYLNAAKKATIRQIVLRGFQEGLTTDEQSRMIRQHIGLLPKHVIAVKNYRASLKDLDPTIADKLEAKYAKKLLKYRADTIALSEGHAAANEGYRAANAGAVQRGILNPDKWEQYWMITRDKRLCPKCEALSGARADLPDGDFKGDGRGPPLHARCRCTIGLRRR
jgi:hypothetical protein